MTDAERQRILLLWNEGRGMSLRMLERHFERRFTNRQIRAVIVEAGLASTISQPRGNTWQYRRMAPLDQHTGKPIGKLPPGHRLAPVDDVILREREFARQREAQRRRALQYAKVTSSPP